MAKSNGREIIALVILLAASVLLCLFFAFVGYMKASAPLSLLMQHHAWTIYVPETAGRVIGWSEIICALLLIGGVFRPIFGIVGAATLLINQIIAAAVHMSHQEMGALPQNGVLVALCLLILVLQLRRLRTVRPYS